MKLYVNKKYILIKFISTMKIWDTTQQNLFLNPNAMQNIKYYIND